MSHYNYSNYLKTRYAITGVADTDVIQLVETGNEFLQFMFQLEGFTNAKVVTIEVSLGDGAFRTLPSAGGNIANGGLLFEVTLQALAIGGIRVKIADNDDDGIIYVSMYDSPMFSKRQM